MLTTFWNYEGVLTDFLEIDATVNSERQKPYNVSKNSTGRKGQKVVISCFNEATIDASARYGFTLLPHPARISLPAIFTSSAN
jgi:hypothetical protein